MPISTSKEKKPTGRSGKKTRLHLRKGIKLGESLREVAALQLDAAMKRLKEEGVPPDAIHDARTYIKKLRAIVQIASSTLPPPFRKKLTNSLKKAASRMGPLRDSEVRLQTLDLLLKNTKAPLVQFSSLRSGLADVSKQERLSGPKQIPLVLGALRSVSDSLPDWPLDKLGPKDIRRRIRRTYRRGRITFDLCSSTRDPDDFHLWRKQVKQLWYQLRLTAPYWPREGKKLISAAGEIGHLAGVERDHTLLAATIAKGPQSRASLLIQEAIAELLPDLRKKAIKGGELLYSKKPKAFMEELGL